MSRRVRLQYIIVEKCSRVALYISRFPKTVIERFKVDKRIRIQKLLFTVFRDKIFKSLWLKCSVTNVHNMYHAQYAQDIIPKNQ